jgi:hypothetical protein
MVRRGHWEGTSQEIPSRSRLLVIGLALHEYFRFFCRFYLVRFMRFASIGRNDAAAMRGRPTAPDQSSVNSAAGTGGPK